MEAEEILNSVKEAELDFFMFLGDLVMSANNEEYDEAMELIKKFPIPVYFVFGNHDGDGGTEDFELYNEHIGKANYRFVYNNDLFLILDGAQQSVSRKIFDYAEKSLKASNETNKFVFIHVPPFDQSGIRGNSFNTSFDGARFMNLMIQNEVDIIFSGHIHTYQDYMISGVRSIVAGMGGGVPEALDGVGYGYIIVERNEKGVFVNRVDVENK
jgi:predicted phosphodiesterase